jgi:hypothetical protein
MYVHDPSLLTVLCKGKTIQGTIPQFNERLESLLTRLHFDEAFIEKELPLVKEGFVVSKTNSKSMLGKMNALAASMVYNCRQYPTYDTIDTDQIEMYYSTWLTGLPGKPHIYTTAINYWKEKGALSMDE